MTGRKPIWIVERRHTVVVKGAARALLEAGAFKPIYVGTVRGWLLDRNRLPDLLAYLDVRGVAYFLTPYEDTAEPPAAASPRRAVPDQPGLWDGHGGDAA